MTRERFTEIVAEVLDSLPDEFRRRVRNLAVIVEDRPPESSTAPRRHTPPKPGDPRSRPQPLLIGEFVGIPATQRSVFDQPIGPNRIVLYQKNIEAVCGTEEELHEEIRLTVMHELGHYFGMDEDQLWDV